MANPLNPLNWIKSTQDWFSKSERSSGFRPYLIFLILVFVIGFSLLSFYKTVPHVNIIALGLISLSVVSFIVIYCIKSFTDPNFCRSEQHIQKLVKLELERMGNESNQIEGNIIETQMIENVEKEPESITSNIKDSVEEAKQQ